MDIFISTKTTQIKMLIKKLSYKLAKILHRKYHKHTKYWYYICSQFFIFQFIEMLILLGISFILNTIIETFLGLLGFHIIRMFHGKYHLDSYGKCIIFSTLYLITIGLISNIVILPNNINSAFLSGIIFGYLIDTKIGLWLLNSFSYLYDRLFKKSS